MYKVNYEKETGTILGYYSSEGNAICPKPYIAITDDERKEASNPNKIFIVKEGKLHSSTRPAPSLETLKEEYISTVIYPAFQKEKEAIVWVDNYGFDCEPVDTANWNAALILAERSEEKGTCYSVWKSPTEKDFIWLTVKQLIAAGNATREQQMKAYKRFAELRKEVENAHTIEEVENIKW